MTVTSWKGPGCGNRTRISGSSTEWLLNTAHMFNVKDGGDSDVSFYYVDNLYGLKSHGNYVEADETLADVLTAYDATYNAEYISLPVYEDDDTSVAVTSRVIPAKSISRARADNQNSERSFVWYCEGEKTIRVLINYSIAELLDFIDTGSTSTGSAS